MKAPSPPESVIQREIVSYLRTVAPHCLTFAVPNAARRTARGFASNAVAGLTAGIPDLCMIAPAGRAYFIEVKSATGDLRSAQEAIRLRLIKMNVPYCVARSIEDVRVALKHWNIETREHAYDPADFSGDCTSVTPVPSNSSEIRTGRGA